MAVFIVSLSRRARRFLVNVQNSENIVLRMSSPPPDRFTGFTGKANTVRNQIPGTSTRADPRPNPTSSTVLTENTIITNPSVKRGLRGASLLATSETPCYPTIPLVHSKIVISNTRYSNTSSYQ